jgi:hypothetical protein
MSRYWLHVNYPNDKARIHKDGGCRYVRNAAIRVRSGAPYGRILGDRNGLLGWSPLTLLRTPKLRSKGPEDQSKTAADYAGDDWPRSGLSGEAIAVLNPSVEAMVRPSNDVVSDYSPGQAPPALAEVNLLIFRQRSVQIDTEHEAVLSHGLADRGASFMPPI